MTWMVANRLISGRCADLEAIILEMRCTICHLLILSSTIIQHMLLIKTLADEQLSILSYYQDKTLNFKNYVMVYRHMKIKAMSRVTTRSWTEKST